MTKSPFPGMDPYLEQAWRDVHQKLCVYACDDLQSQILDAGLVARVDERLVVEQPDEEEYRGIFPDVRVSQRQPVAPRRAGSGSGVTLAEPITVDLNNELHEESFIQIIDARSGGRVITVIEVVSITNKIPGPGRRQYRRKQVELRKATVSLVEIDLLRGGKHVTQIPRWKISRKNRTPYSAVVHRAWNGSKYHYYRIPLREPLPTIAIPLRRDDADATLNLQSLIDRVYQNGAYAMDLDYARPPIPPLEPEDMEWASQVLRQSSERK